jgi:cyanophycin synthetase
VDRLEVTGRRTVVISAPGDRRDEDVQAMADEVAGHFDHFICKADHNRRGRGVDEVPQLLRSRLLERGVDSKAVEVIPEEPEAVAKALEQSREGDLVVIFGDNITRTWKQVVSFDSSEDQAAAGGETAKANSYVEEDPGAFKLEPGEELIRDERGVRIARQDVEDGD